MSVEISTEADVDRRQAVFDVERPWGTFRQFCLNEGTTVKIITVSPGRRLSLQHHARRGELWQVLEGTVEVTLGHKTWLATQGELVWVRQGMLHRLSNPGRQTARVLEIAFGDFDEEDIVRIEDDFDRT